MYVVAAATGVAAAAPLAITFKAVVVLANANDPHKTDKSQAESGERHRSRAALPEAHTHTHTCRESGITHTAAVWSFELLATVFFGLERRRN